MDLPARFWEKVDRSGDCWLWTACTNRKGYGKFSIGGGRWALAHRVSYEATSGSVPPGLQLMHDCDTPRCVNPSHLKPGTLRKNMTDRRDRRLPHALYTGLTWADVRTIREQYTGKRGEIVAFAKRFSVNRETVARVIRGDSWAEEGG